MNKKFIRSICLSLIACFALQVPALPQVMSGDLSSRYYVLSPEAYGSYELGAGDLLEVHVIIGDNAVARDYELVVSNDGSIFFPNVGRIKVDKLKVGEAERLIRKELSKKIESDFRLNVVLSKPRLTRVFYGREEYMPTIEKVEKYVYVYGEVARPGRYNYFDGKSISDYLNLAGGPAPRANLSSSTLTRKTDSESKVYSVNAYEILFKGDKFKDLAVKEGDIINVPSNFFYFTDFASFANTLILGLTLFYSVQNFMKR